ncbi:MAG: hypothetical protein LBL13_10800 [Bacteroidales bacterium]|jgi:hypothetical protein|nr:hypothetical protein [Bacteroidales bacterium]
MNTQIKFKQTGNCDCNTLLDQFAKTTVHSIMTSSIPLVQFWIKSAPEIQLTKLEKLSKITMKDVTLWFEYPTSPLQGRGGSSMTDLMILSEENKVAIEAKYTEYLNEPETVSKWLGLGENPQNRKTVLEGWWNKIAPFRRNAKIFSNDIEYQFLHRTASACNGAKKAVVIYQLFYDEKTCKGLELFKQKIRQYVDIINPTSDLEFYIWEIETGLIGKETNGYNPFEKMKTENLFVFGKEKLDCIM